MRLAADDPTAVALHDAIRSGEVEALRALLARQPELARARIEGPGGARTALHLATDWPGHPPRVAETIRTLIAAGAPVDAPFEGAHAETPLHWAASNDDVRALEALLDAGADPDRAGSVVDGGPPLSDAVAFGRWNAARRLVERGATPGLWHAAGLGRLADVRAQADAASPAELTTALWCAAHGGQRETAAWLLDRGADRDWRGFDGLTAAQAADREGHAELAAWLRWG